MTNPGRIAVLWDIDGTLLTTARAGVVALEDGVSEILDRRENLGSLITSGLTDRMVARAILVALKLDPDPDIEDALLGVYCRQLPYRLSQGRGRVMEGVIDILDGLRERDDVTMSLLTGNLRAGASAKLRTYGLDHYFDLTDGGFGDDGYDRIEIAERFLDRFTEKHTISRESIYLVGDTPFDVRCGNAVGIRTIAVASGLHDVEELAADAPWWALERLPAPDAFLSMLSLPLTSTPPLTGS